MRIPLKFRHAHAFVDGEARQSARSSPPWRLSNRSKESAFLSRQWRFCAKYQVNASLGERSRSRFPDEGASGTAAVSEPPAFTTRNADGCQDSPRRCQSAAGKMPEARPTHGPPTLGEMCARFTGIKQCAAGCTSERDLPANTDRSRSIQLVPGHRNGPRSFLRST